MIRKRAGGMVPPAGRDRDRGRPDCATAAQSGPTGTREGPIRRLSRPPGWSRLAPMTSSNRDPMVTGPALHQAAERLARLGFVVVNGSHPEETGTAQLLVALRSRPTMEHFDPELVEHWVTSGGRGRMMEITRAANPHHEPFSWGTIRVVDRVDAFNSFLSFGGDKTVAALDADTTIIVFESPAPIVRFTGHSQSVDPLAGEVGAFFARMKVPIDFTPGVEQRIAEMSPRALHAAMLAALQRRYAHNEALRDAHPTIAAWASREAHRMREGHPAEWTAGEQLTADLDLDRD